MKILSILALTLFLMSIPFVAAADSAAFKKECQKWALEDENVKPWELSDYVKACTAYLEKTSSTAERFDWKK